MKTRFPARTLSELARLGTLDSDVSARLASGLSAIQQQIYPFEAVAEVVDKTLPNAADSERKALGSAISSFLFVAASTSSQSTDDVLDTATEALRADQSDETVDKARAFLRNLLGNTDLLVSFKGTALVEDGDRLLIDSKLLVDVRPVFDSSGISAGIPASVLLCRLRMTYRATSGTGVQAIVFTLREEELDELEAVIKRGKDKVQTIRQSSQFGKILESKK